MKLVVILYIQSSFSLTIINAHSSPNRESPMADAVSRAIARYGPPIQARYQSPLHIGTFKRSFAPRRYQQDLLERILQLLKGELLIQFDGPAISSTFQKPTLNNLILVDGYTSFRTFLATIDNRYDISGLFWIALGNSNGRKNSYSLLQAMFEQMWRNHILYAFIFVTNEDGIVQLYSYFPYTESSCEVIEPTLIDQYDDYLLRPRLRNFHGCPLRGGTFDIPPYIFIDTNEFGKQVLRGFEGHLVNVISKQLNFTLHVVTPPNGDLWGSPGANNNSTGLCQLIVDELADFGIGCIGLTEDRVELMTPGMTHHNTEVTFAVPNGRPYSAFEKLFLPFSANTWYALLAFVGVAVVNIAIVNFQRTSLKAFVFGDGIRTPMINLINSLFGGSLVRCPRRNFARALLMLWIMYNLVIRTAYQGSLYKYLQVPKNYSAPRTLAEIYQAELFYYMLDIDAQYFTNNPKVLERMRFHSESPGAMARMIERVGRGELDGAMLVTEDQIAYHNKFHPPAEFIQITRESVCSISMSVFYPKNSMLKWAFDRVIMKMKATGLIEFWASRYGDYNFFRRAKTDPVTAALSIGHLLGAFETLGLLVVVSFLVFLLELMGSRWDIFKKFATNIQC